MKLMIDLSALDETPCHDYYDKIIQEFDKTGKFDAVEMIGGDMDNLLWLIANCKLAQTQEMIDYFKSLGPNAYSVSRLILNCEFARTQEMIDYFKSLGPNASDVRWLISNCKFAQTPKMLGILKGEK